MYNVVASINSKNWNIMFIFNFTMQDLSHITEGTLAQFGPCSTPWRSTRLWRATPRWWSGVGARWPRPWWPTSTTSSRADLAPRTSPPKWPTWASCLPISTTASCGSGRYTTWPTKSWKVSLLNKVVRVFPADRLSYLSTDYLKNKLALT